MRAQFTQTSKGIAMLKNDDELRRLERAKLTDFKFARCEVIQRPTYTEYLLWTREQIDQVDRDAEMLLSKMEPGPLAK